MTSKTQDQRLAFEAMVRANAVSYSIQLFIGRGQFERAEADTLAEAISIGKAMKEAHPTCHAQPIYYAIEPSGHSTTITPAQFQESMNMIKTAVTTESAAANVVNIEALRREKNAERMRAARAAKKAAPTQLPIAGSRSEAEANFAEMTEAAHLSRADKEVIAQLAATLNAADAAKAAKKAEAEATRSCEAADRHIDMVAEALGVEAPADLGFIPPPVEPSAEDVAAYAEHQEEAQTLGTSLNWFEAEAPTAEPAKKSGLCPTREQALVEGRKVYGATAKVGDEFEVKKTARGEWFWGPVEAAKKPTPAKGARKAAKAPRAAKAVKPAPASKAASGKRADVLAAAERGEIPAVPDFTADTHKRFRPALADVVAMVEAGNIAGLKANKIEPLSSSRAAICRYRDLAIVALKAKAR